MDPTEQIRRDMVAGQGNDERAALEAIWGDVFSTDELREHFVAEGFLAPFVVVTRKSDGVRGTLQFQASPRFYFGFEEVSR